MQRKKGRQGKVFWVLLTGVVMLTLMLSGCGASGIDAQVAALARDKAALETQVGDLTQSKTGLESRVQSLTVENGNLTARVQTLVQEKTALQQNATKTTLLIDNLATASNVTMTGGQLDWRTYTARDSFPSGYQGTLWVMFNFSNMLHDGNVNVTADIYVLSKTELKTVKNKEASLANSTDNSLFWGDFIDISKYPDGDYTVILNIKDTISGTAAAATTAFKVGNTN